MEALLREYGYTRDSLAAEVNRVAEQVLGKPSACTDRHVRRWLSGQVRWPWTRYLLPLQEIFGRPPEALGFVPRSASSAAPAPPQQRLSKGRENGPEGQRSFLADSVVAVLGLDQLPEHGRIGASDIARIDSALARLDSHFNGLGGGAVSEAASELLIRLRRTAADCTYSSRIEAELYRTMSAAAACGGWSSHDCGRPERAARLRHDALQAALLSRDPAAVTRAWSDLAVQAEQEQRPREAARIVQTALDERHLRHAPQLAALLHARLADYLAADDPRGMGRHLAAADRAYDRVSAADAASWLAFLTPAELRGLGALAHQSAGQYGRAEALTAEARGLLGSGFPRNHAYYTVLLGELQLAQGKRDAAKATAATLHSAPIDSVRITSRLHQLTAALGQPPGDMR
ncbi:hypothetical protein [Streptomyces sp. NPDC057702]|uniref:hypothetical protein n=1 Tax=unclassified Streptomyces TaxID=2593676 RepID=UPI00369231D0